MGIVVSKIVEGCVAAGANLRLNDFGLGRIQYGLAVSSAIDLCLSMYDWARFRRTKGAVRLNLPPFALDGKDDCPSWVSGANIVIANQTKTVIQKTNRHTSPHIIGNLSQFPFGVVCPFFSSQKYA
jgi:hypothetical protein